MTVHLFGEVEPIYERCNHIILIGCGSVGSFLSILLARMTNRLTLVDFDKVEPNNSATHVISLVLCGPEENKANALKMTLDSMYPHCYIGAIDSQGENLQYRHIHGHNAVEFIIIAVDSIEARAKIIKNIREQLDQLPNLKYVVDTGISERAWRLAMIPPDELENYENSLSDIPEREPDEERACHIVRNVTIIANLGAQLSKKIAEVMNNG